MGKFIGRFRTTLGSLPRDLAIALLVTVVATIAATPIVALLTQDKLRAWTAALIAAAALLVGLLLGATVRAAGDSEGLDKKIRELESRTGELGAYETYAEHLRDALRDLRRVVANELPSFRLVTSSRREYSSRRTLCCSAIIEVRREATYGSRSFARRATTS
jgi:hypothetical protein